MGRSTRREFLQDSALAAAMAAAFPATRLLAADENPQPTKEEVF